MWLDEWPGVGSRWAGAPPPSIADIDMLPPAFPVLGMEFSAGSSRPAGNALGGPRLTGGPLDADGCP